MGHFEPFEQAELIEKPRREPLANMQASLELLSAAWQLLRIECIVWFVLSQKVASNRQARRSDTSQISRQTRQLRQGSSSHTLRSTSETTATQPHGVHCPPRLARV